MEYPHDIWNNNVRLKLVGVHPQAGTAFYINDGHGGLLGVRVYPSGTMVVVYPKYVKLPPSVKRDRKDGYVQFRDAWGSHKSIYASHAVYTAWVGPIKPGMTIDHINGCTTDNRFENLRQIPLSINQRDGGFLTKLRNKGINPATIDRPYLLRYYDRMATLKAFLSAWHYYCLSKDQLLKIVYDDEFLISLF